MIIYVCHFHPEGFFLVCDHPTNFWVKLSPLVDGGVSPEFAPIQNSRQMEGFFN